MDRHLLDDLQRRSAYPTITVLANTTRDNGLDDVELMGLRAMINRVDERLADDVDDDTRVAMVEQLHTLLEAHRDQPATSAVALCVSPELATVVRLGRPVRERVVIDDSFATRDLVADLNRTAQFRLVTVSERKVRVFLGDRHRIVEQRDDVVPLLRDDDEPKAVWAHRTDSALRDLHTDRPLPTVLAGVDRSLRDVTAVPGDSVVGTIKGAHDRTQWSELHTAAWPLVVDWLRADRRRALDRLEAARSAARYAGGIDEVYALATDGRVALVVVEEGFELPVRLKDHDQLERAEDDPEAPDVVDDIVDDTIELVLTQGGEAVMVADGDLDEAGRIAAVLRF